MEFPNLFDDDLDTEEIKQDLDFNRVMLDSLKGSSGPATEFRKTELRKDILRLEALLKRNSPNDEISDSESNSIEEDRTIRNNLHPSTRSVSNGIKREVDETSFTFRPTKARIPAWGLDGPAEEDTNHHSDSKSHNSSQAVSSNDLSNFGRSDRVPSSGILSTPIVPALNPQLTRSYPSSLAPVRTYYNSPSRSGSTPSPSNAYDLKRKRTDQSEDSVLEHGRHETKVKQESQSKFKSLADTQGYVEISSDSEDDKMAPYRNRNRHAQATRQLGIGNNGAAPAVGPYGRPYSPAQAPLPFRGPLPPTGGPFGAMPGSFPQPDARQNQTTAGLHLAPNDALRFPIMGTVQAQNSPPMHHQHPGTFPHEPRMGASTAHLPPDYGHNLEEAVDTDRRDIEELLNNIRPDEEILAGDREGAPAALLCTLMEHQKLGYAWMKKMEDSRNKGGILADDMGLGKTVQALALMVARPPPRDQHLPTLIVCPVALLQQWRREIKRWVTPERALQVHIYHGPNRYKSWQELKKYDVIITTYGAVGSDYRRYAGENSARERGLFVPDRPLGQNGQDRMDFLDMRAQFFRIILDEAHNIRNRSTNTAKGAWGLHSTYRWCLTGTPMMNNVTELYSLIRFLRIKPYNNLTAFRKTFELPLNKSAKVKDDAMKQLQILLKAVLLRRTKSSQINGQPILNLPDKHIQRDAVDFNEDEATFYKQLETRSQHQVNRYLEAENLGKNYSNILVLLLRLRQACCHPHLIQDFAPQHKDDMRIENAKLLPEDAVQRLKETEALECPICLDASENPLIYIPCGHYACVDCFALITAQDQVNQARDDQNNNKVKCPTCRGEIDPDKCTDYTSFKIVHEGIEPDETGLSSDEDEEDEDADDAGSKSLDEYVASDSSDDGDDDYDSGDKELPKEQGLGRLSVARIGTPTAAVEKARKKKVKHVSIAEMRKRAVTSQKSKRKWLKKLAKNWISSSKIDQTMEVLRQARGRGEKTIIFSQFTSLLDLVEVALYKESVRYSRYDGSLSPKQRNDAITEFSDDPLIDVILVSIKAGNAGLNLTAATHIIIMDPFWNPYVEDQAVDRAHRIGQTRDVHVHRILVPNTVEDRILALQEKKREMIEQALDEQEHGRIARLGRRELAFLFNLA